jgi:hypothetical protein
MYCWVEDEFDGAADGGGDVVWREGEAAVADGDGLDARG